MSFVAVADCDHRHAESHDRLCTKVAPREWTERLLAEPPIHQTDAPVSRLRLDQNNDGRCQGADIGIGIGIGIGIWRFEHFPFRIWSLSIFGFAICAFEHLAFGIWLASNFDFGFALGSSVTGSF